MGCGSASYCGPSEERMPEPVNVQLEGSTVVDVPMVLAVSLMPSALSREPFGTLLFVDFADQSATGIEGGSFPALLRRRAPKSDFLKWFAAFSKPKGLTEASWMELVPPVAGAVRDLGWMTEPERAHISGCILDFVLQAFTDMWRPGEHSSAVVGLLT